MVEFLKNQIHTLRQVKFQNLNFAYYSVWHLGGLNKMTHAYILTQF